MQMKRSLSLALSLFLTAAVSVLRQWLCLALHFGLFQAVCVCVCVNNPEVFGTVPVEAKQFHFQSQCSMES